MKSFNQRNPSDQFLPNEESTWKEINANVIHIYFLNRVNVGVYLLICKAKAMTKHKQKSVEWYCLKILNHALICLKATKPKIIQQKKSIFKL